MRGKRLAGLDFSTINVDRLKMLTPITLPPTYRLQDDCGNGCAGDPPGYPTYFTRSVYTQYGNSPGRGPETVITFEGRHYCVEHSRDWRGGSWEELQGKREKLYRELWRPLPIDHERTRAWIQATYAHHHHMYLDDAGEYQTGKDYRKDWNSFVFPVPYYKLESFRDDPRFSDEWRMREKARVEMMKAEIIALASKIATPENHCAVRIVRRYYPEHEPILEWIKTSPGQVGNWWETAAKRPTPEECPGQYSMTHPCNGSWCQWCGWRQESGDGTEKGAA